MRSIILLLSSGVLAVSAIVSIVTGAAAPLWLVVPGLAFAMGLGLLILAQQWLRLVVLGATRLVVVVVALAVLSVGIAALASTPGAWPWIVWPTIMTALLALLFAINYPSARTARHA